MKQGLIIARSKSSNQFFTASSSYDNPVWTALEEATVYYSEQNAEAAVKKLWLRGHFSAKIKPLAEMEMEFELPEERPRDDKREFELSDDVDADDDVEAHCDSDESLDGVDDIEDVEGMTDEEPVDDVEAELLRHMGEGEAAHSASRFLPMQTVCIRDNPSQHFIVQQDAGTGNVTISPVNGGVATTVPSHTLVKVQEGLSLEPMDGNAARSRDAERKWQQDQATGANKKIFVVFVENGKRVKKGPMSATAAKQIADMKRGKIVMESETMPAKPPLDAKPSENKDTVLNAAKPKTIEIKDPAATVSDVAGAVSGEPTDKIKIPAGLMSELATAIAAAKKQADNYAGRDDATASFQMQCHDCMVEVQDALKAGTVESLKAIQVRLSSWMSPIINSIPSAVHKFVLSGGVRPSLKDMFDAKKAEKK